MVALAWYESQSLGGLATTALLILSAIVMIASRYFQCKSTHQEYLAGLPWVGMRKQIFPELRAGARFITSSRDVLASGYAKYSKMGAVFAVPQLGSEPQLTLPPEYIEDFAHLPRNAADTEKMNREAIAMDHTPALGIGDLMHMGILGGKLTRNLYTLAPFIEQEITLGLESRLTSADEQWVTTDVYSMCKAVIARAAIRAFAGEALCRSPEFVRESVQYAEAMFTTGTISRCAPRSIRSLIAPLIWSLCGANRHYQVAKRFLLPLIKERVAAVQANELVEEKDKPKDAMQWIVEESVRLAKDDSTQLEDDRLVKRLVDLNLAAIHSTSITLANTINFIYASKDRDAIVATLLEEVTSVLSESHGEFTRQAVSSLHHIDSAIREALRRCPISDFSLRREVTAKAGISLGQTFHIPYGIRFMVPAHSIHHDKEIYGEDADNYDPFRFSRIQTEDQPTKPEKSQSVRRGPVMTSTSSEFLSFGHGTHVCPGRFFSSLVMKIMLAHIVTCYDAELVKDIPTETFGDFHYPSSKVQLRVKQLKRD